MQRAVTHVMQRAPGCAGKSHAVVFDAALERTLLESGADLLRLETDKSYAEPLLAFFRRRESMLWR
jgi:hypothetical protein